MILLFYVSDVFAQGALVVMTEVICWIVRFTALSRPIEIEFQRAGIPNRILGGHKFFDRVEVGYFFLESQEMHPCRPLIQYIRSKTSSRTSNSSTTPISPQLSTEP